jgi:hypothetical protein
MAGIPARCLSYGLEEDTVFENETVTRCTIGGTGVVLGLVVVLAHLPLLFLVLPVAVVFLGIVADPEETHAVWFGMLNTLGIFDVSTLTDAENVNYVQKKHYFWFGEVGMAGILAGSIAVPAGIWFAGQTEISLAFIGAAVLFLPLFVFMPKLIQCGMKADTEAAINAFGKNEQVRKVFWTLFVAMAGLVLARVVDPVTAQQVVGIITGMGV